MAKIKITTFYRFFPIAEQDLDSCKQLLFEAGQARKIYGLFLLGTEGCNATICGPESELEAYKQELQNILNVNDIVFKDSWANSTPFHVLKVKIKPEIVTLGRKDLVPNSTEHFHLSPDEWDKLLKQEDVVVIDTRNDYEYELGHFKGAINPNIKEFRTFPEYLQKAEIPKDKKVLIYCTGGIRCEKAILEMEEQGYQNVYQLDGGILNYLKKYPNQEFKGECFVFDYRVAVNQELKPTSQWRLCPHCGDPGNKQITCVQCGIEEMICQSCHNESEHLQTCSKNCAHHHRLGHRTRRIHWDALNKRHPFDSESRKN